MYIVICFVGIVSHTKYLFMCIKYLLRVRIILSINFIAEDLLFGFYENDNKIHIRSNYFLN